jgi:hypothetical protein
MRKRKERRWKIPFATAEVDLIAAQFVVRWLPLSIAAHKDRSMTLIAADPSGIHAQESNTWGLPKVFRRFGLLRPVREQEKLSVHAPKDGYLLVLLADQELEAGRGEQARCLLEAAYAAFDATTGTC